MTLGTIPWTLCFAGLIPLVPFQGTQGGAAELEVTAHWEGMASSKYRLHERLPALAAVARPAPAEPVHSYERAFFDRLLPTDELEPGAVWRLDVDSLVPLLMQFHPGATAKLHHGGGGEGAHAVLLARDERWIDLLFRMHAEFELGDEAFLTVAQFEGRAVFERGRGIRTLSLRLPPRDTNADVNARDGEYGVADIGLIPRMELAGGEPLPDELARGDEELELARAKLRRAFYRFAEIEWRPLAEALERSREEQKPLHVLILFGALDDESC